MSKHGPSPLAGQRPVFDSYSFGTGPRKYQASPDSTRGRTRGPQFPVNESNRRDANVCPDCSTVLPVIGSCPDCSPAVIDTPAIKSRKRRKRAKRSQAQAA